MRPRPPRSTRPDTPFPSTTPFHSPRVDFPLRKSATTGSDLDVLVFADPQPKSHTDIDHYRRDIVEPLRGTSAALGLTLGDIVDDDLSLYPDIHAVTSSPNLPWLHVAGNPDTATDAQTHADSSQTFRRPSG